MKKSLFLLLAAFTLQMGNAQSLFVNTAVGNGTPGNVNGAAANCELYWPYNVKSDNDSILYFADTYNNCIKKLNYNTNIVSLVAGNGSGGFQNGIGTTAMFNLPGGMFYKNGYLYVADCGNNMIRMIDLNNNNTVSTFAGTGTLGFANGSVSSAQFNNPFSVYIVSNGDMYIADYGNHCIRLISGGQVTTFAGTPTSSGFTNGANATSKFNLPRDIVIDANGDMLVADQSNHVIRKISGGQVTTFSGSGAASTVDGSASTASFYYPTGVCVGASGNFYVCEVGNKVRRVDPAGNVLSLAGTGASGFLDGTAASAQFNTLAGICYDPRGYVYLADKVNNRIRRLFVADVAAINSFSEKNIFLKAYPSPSNNSITIESSTEDGFITIYNTLGEVVYYSAINTRMIIDITDQAEGVFYVQLKNKEATLTKKIVIQH